MFLAENPYLEMEYIAKEITKLVKQQKYRYNQIGIVTKDVEGYSEDAKAIFQKYQIPLFIETKKELNQNILIKYIINLLEIYSKNWSYDSIMDFLKVGLNEFDEDDIYEFENYSKKWGIRGSKWYNREFNYEPINEKQTKLEVLRKSIISPIVELKNRIQNEKTFYEITKELYNFLS